MPAVFLLGGGWSPAIEPLYGAFLAAAGSVPTISCVVLDEGDGLAQFGRWDDVLRRAGSCVPVPVLLPTGSLLDLAAMPACDGLVICGGLTPAYAEALAGVDLAGWLQGRPYAGFSAGAAVAAERAVVGGWLDGGTPVCPEDAAEDLDDVSIVPGLGLVPFVVDVHCAPWGTLPRLLVAVRRLACAGVALDEDTMLVWDGTTVAVSGAGRAHAALPGAEGIEVRTLSHGDRLQLLA